MDMLGQVRRNCAVSIRSSGLMSCLSLSTMTLLVLASVVIITIINVTPIVILGLGELQDGQRDLIITPRDLFLNASALQALAGYPAMPRHSTVLFTDSGTQAHGWFMDFQLERDLHLGTIAGGQPADHSFLYAHEGLNLKAGARTTVSMIDRTVVKAIRKWVESAGVAVGEREQVLRELDLLTYDSSALRGSFEVREVFSTSAGKFGIGNVNNYIYLDIRYAFQQMLEQTYAAAGKDVQGSPLIRLLRSPAFSLAHFSTEITINLPNRIEVYSSPDYEATHTRLSHFGQSILQRVGIFAVSTRMPIAGNLITLGYVGMFVGVMLKLIIVSLFLLSAIMMNNMLLMGVERKNFDFALLKVMGAGRLFVVLNLLAGSLKYVLLANFAAFPLAYLVLGAVTGVFEGFFGYKHEITPTFAALVGGVVIGVFVPVVSSIAPIWGVINNDLVQNLNPIRNKTEAIQTEVYVEGREFPWGKVLFGVLATSYGLMVYYLLPKALINQNVGLLLSIFFLILEGLLIGLILLSYSFQYGFERVVAYLALFWANSTDFLLTLKNLSAHRFKNRRSSILYALSVSFIIFVSVGLQIQLQTIYNELLKKRGCYVEVSGMAIDREFYNNFLPTVAGVEEWAFVTLPLSKYLAGKGVSEIMISDRAKLFFAKNEILGVSPNLMSTFFFEKVSVWETEAQPPYDPYSYLYSEAGFMTCTLSKYIADRFGLLDSHSSQFYINMYYSDRVRRVPIRYSSIFDKRIGLLYSSILPISEVGVSFDTFRALADIPSDALLPIEKIKVKIRNGADAGRVAGRIRGAGVGDRVWEYSELRDTIGRISQLLSSILGILLVVVLVISFFSLVTTSYVNILNQTNEIAILMILGYPRARIVRIFVYESFVLVLNSCAIGVAVGYFVAWMMGLQRELFSDLPVEIQVTGLPTILVAAVVSSLLSTYKPLADIFKHSISQIINYAH